MDCLEGGELRVTSAPEASWEKFEGCRAHSVYFMPAFWRFLESVAGGRVGVLVALRGAQPVGWLPYLAAEIKGGRHVVNSLPWFGSLGGCFLFDRSDQEARDALLRAYADTLRALEVLVAVTILPPEESKYADVYCDALGSCGIERRRGQMSYLPHSGGGSDELLLDAYRGRTRRMVRKAQRQGYEIIDGRELDWAWDFLAETHHANMAAIGGRAKSRQHFAALRKMPPGLVGLTVACENGDPAAALLLLYGGSQVEYCIPAIADAHRSRQPLSLLIHDAMKMAAERGYLLWNWGGTHFTQESLHHFKAGWGASDYFYEYLLTYKREELSVIREGMGQMAAAYPYYYIFPFSSLEDDADLFNT